VCVCVCVCVYRTQRDAIVATKFLHYKWKQISSDRPTGPLTDRPDDRQWGERMHFVSFPDGCCATPGVNGSNSSGIGSNRFAGLANSQDADGEIFARNSKRVTARSPWRAWCAGYCLETRRRRVGRFDDYLNMQVGVSSLSSDLADRTFLWSQRSKSRSAQSVIIATQYNQLLQSDQRPSVLKFRIMCLQTVLSHGN
jgi:hypothetical protein